MSNILLRSLMFVPGHNEKLLESASRSDADVLLLDIEDSVQPISNKQIARDRIVERINNGVFKDHMVFPRINDRESGQLLKDLMQLSIEGVDGFMYPKSYTGEDVYFIDKLLDTIEYEKGFPKGKFKLIPLIETSAAVLNAQDICKASDRVIAIAYGSEDFISDLEGIHDREHQSLFTPRAIIAMAARANNVIPIDTVHINVHDMEDLEYNLKLSKNLGFEGMLVLNPKELPLVHSYFSPSKRETENAEEMLRLYEKAKIDGKGVALMNGKFIGPPMVLAAKKVINRSNLIKQKNKNNE
ncbi:MULTISPECIES: HpcH/HpaI aldolase/citrate lyase family protein [unclassified Tenacibaculum]|uniref:HpcH/HpaI aldolase/citrate lyase family protein n=1 Tax=unclassified Tenacibaculum TaxID=2635139 RepID=UPI001F258AF9|nr:MULTISPECIES: CoA ester lyase [unclassified Tenacibaculum]MCF2876615.1 CoA ester lyase [Tenacibaculum sp. Cn5-1]MCF2936766.1 CoA ester lyase [Tenacibaculum sp. Cn5-34]MCG7512990.1 CoA ester lyase [Tenacibaculum sp. Cn5-46]